MISGNTTISFKHKQNHFPRAGSGDTDDGGGGTRRQRQREVARLGGEQRLGGAAAARSGERPTAKPTADASSAEFAERRRCDGCVSESDGEKRTSSRRRPKPFSHTGLPDITG